MAFNKTRPSFDESKFQEALEKAASLFQVEHFFEDQEAALRNFFQGKNMVFQAISVIADIMAEKVIGTSVFVVISPLTSLMKDQVKITTEWHGISAAAIVVKMTKFYRTSKMAFTQLFTRPQKHFLLQRDGDRLLVHLAFKRIVLQSLSMKHIVWFTGGYTYNRICLIIWRNFCVIQ